MKDFLLWLTQFYITVHFRVNFILINFKKNSRWWLSTSRRESTLEARPNTPESEPSKFTLTSRRAAWTTSGSRESTCRCLPPSTEPSGVRLPWRETWGEIVHPTILAQTSSVQSKLNNNFFGLFGVKHYKYKPIMFISVIFSVWNTWKDDLDTVVGFYY